MCGCAAAQILWLGLLLSTLRRPHQLLISSPPWRVCGLIAPPNPSTGNRLLPLISAVKGQEMTVPRWQGDERMQESHFKSFLLTYSFFSTPTSPADATSRRFPFLGWFLTVLHCSFPWKTCYPLISRPGRGRRDPEKPASCLVGLDLALALDLGLSWASRSGLAPAEFIPAPSWLSVASQTRLWPPVPSLGIWSPTVPGE